MEISDGTASPALAIGHQRTYRSDTDENRIDLENNDECTLIKRLENKPRA